MDTPNYTENEQRLMRENRDLRERVRKLEREVLDQISHSGVWVKRLEEKSRQVCELIEKYEPDPYMANH